MSSENTGAANTLSANGNVTTVPVRAKCRVTYEFDTRASSARKPKDQKNNLAIPYVVAVNGQVLPEYSEGPRSLSATVRTITLVVDAGSKVALYLNSDVHPNHRKNPVYEVKVGNNDVQVKVKEVIGRNIGHLRSTLDAPLLKATKLPGKRMEVYDAELTGNIWMEISHVYTSAEAEELMPGDTDPVVRDAVRRVYAGLREAKLELKFPVLGALPAHTLMLKFEDEMQHNVRENTTLCPWLSGVLPRTHPLAYVALLTEARATGVREVCITSGWRPSTGSIGHRAGLGLDINYIKDESGAVPVNREWLTKADGRRNDNVTKEEKRLYEELERARKERAARAEDLNQLKNQLAGAKKTDEKARLEAEVKAATDQLKKAREVQNKAEDAWGKERDKNEPALIRSLRERLIKNEFVKQLLDPWYIDYNTYDKVAPTSNKQVDGTEKAHRDHLHITILEPKILP